MAVTTNMAAQPKVLNSMQLRGVARRDALLGLGALGYIATADSARADTPTGVDIKDDRKALEKGFNIIYEARDLDLPENVRDGFTQARASLVDTKKCISESANRIKTEVLPA